MGRHRLLVIGQRGGFEDDLHVRWVGLEELVEFGVEQTHRGTLVVEDAVDFDGRIRGALGEGRSDLERRRGLHGGRKVASQQDRAALLQGRPRLRAITDREEPHPLTADVSLESSFGEEGLGLGAGLLEEVQRACR